MKKNLLIGLLAIVVFGCTKKNSDNNQPVTNNVDITGNWVTTADTLFQYQNGALKEMDAFTGNPLQLFNFRFNSNGTVIFVSQLDTTDKSSGTYSIKNNIITFVHPSETVDGVTEPGYSQDATIKQHTAHSLMILFDDTFTNQGVTSEDKEPVYMTK
ncbi:MAG: hypothetical protein ACHQHN_00490 [Sphingobacteriales bacterium]